ncbi:MAG TPA: hypothetical protein PKM27_12830 [Saprospiraceae bacterium]|nr:hypothetical protein [Saprospiraceae bacterium]HNT18824.1 hypothetical protein [Saprospiraceae bacterium]
MKKILGLLFGLSLLTGRSLLAQPVQLGVTAGMTVMQGDYPSYRLKDSFRILANPGFGLFIRRPIGSNAGVKASAYFSSFEGDDSLDPDLNGTRVPSRFKYPFIEIQISGDFSPFHFNLARRQVDFFVLAGAGAVKTTINNTDISDDCPIFNLVIPAGAGMRIHLSEQLQASLHAETNLSFSDCLDGYHGLTNVKDMYTSLKLAISYGIVPEAGKSNGRNIGCPRF